MATYNTAPLRVLWLSDFPVERLTHIPPKIFRTSANYHALSWQWVLWQELSHNPTLELHIASLRKQYAKNYSFAHPHTNTTFHLIKTPGGLRAPTLYWTDTWQIQKLCKKINPKIIHAWGSERGAGLVAHRLGLPFILTVQGLMNWYQSVTSLNFHERLAAWIEKRSLPNANIVTTESSFSIGYLQKLAKIKKLVQVEHAPNPIFHSIDRTPQCHPLQFIYVGTWGYRKGTDILLASLDQLSSQFDFELIIVGAVSAKEQFHAFNQIKPAWRSRIKFAGSLNPSQIALYFKTSTMLLFPTRADTSPNAVKEAAVAGVPVVATRVGGIPDYIHDGKNGILAESPTLPHFTKAIVKAVNHPQLGKGETDRDILLEVKNYLSPVRMRETFLQLYQTFL